MNGQFVYKALEYTRAKDLKANLKFDEDDAATAIVLEGLGDADELVLTGRTCYFAGCRIEDLALIAHMAPDGVSFPPLFPRQPFSRLDVSIRRKDEARSRVWIAAEVSRKPSEL